MNGAPYQYCPTCVTERNFKWVNSFDLECKECGYIYTPKMPSPVEFAAQAIKSNNSHLDFEESQRHFQDIVGVTKPSAKDKVPDSPTDVSRGMYAPQMKQGREIQHTPIEFRTENKLEIPSTNLRLFLDGDI